MNIELNAELRTDLGKGASRRLRHAEKMPAILYGADKDPVSLSLEQKDVRAFQDVEAFYTSIINLKIDGKGEKVVVRDVQHHPFKVDMMHIDFQRVDDKHALHMHVPLHFIGEEKSPGVKQGGGIVSHTVIEVEVECLPKDIPEFIEVDMSAMNVGDILHLSDLKLPAGVELRELKQGEDHDAAVCSIHAPKGGGSAAEEEGGEEAAGEE
jgi:large subunit ribosomal protein L25